MSESTKELSGRELDIEIAERVMGWVWMKRVGENVAWLFSPDSKDVDTGEKGFFGEPIIRRNGIVGPFTEYDGNARKEVADLPRWSSSIEAAMQIVGKMQERGFGVRIEDSRTVNASRMTPYDRILKEGQWRVGFLEPERESYDLVIDGELCHGAQQIFSVTASSLSEAICRAALDLADYQNQ